MKTTKTHPKRVVITGIGIIVPSGIGKDQFWENSMAGKSYIERSAEMVDLGFKSSVLCAIKDFDLSKYIDVKSYPGLADLDPYVQYGVVAGEMAMKDANLTTQPLNADRIGTIFSSAIGGTPTIVKIFEQLTEKGKTQVQYQPVGPRFYNSGMFNYPAMLIASKYAFGGLCTSVSTGCTAGLDALGMCYQAIQNDEADIMLAGASEAPLTGLTYATLDVINAMATYEGDAEKSSRPFDAKRSGFVISEGAAAVVIESLEHALARNATIYAEVTAYASVSNSFHMTDLPADGGPMAEVIKRALDSGNLNSDQIDYINAHGSSTPQNDLFETAAYKRVLGTRANEVPISSTKSMIGHSLSSASLVGTTSVIGAIKHSKIHPTINYEFPDPECDLDYVPNVARDAKVNHGLVTASGFGGIHSSVIISKYR